MNINTHDYLIAINYPYIKNYSLSTWLTSIRGPISASPGTAPSESLQRGRARKAGEGRAIGRRKEIVTWHWLLMINCVFFFCLCVCVNLCVFEFNVVFRVDLRWFVFIWWFHGDLMEYTLWYNGFFCHRKRGGKIVINLRTGQDLLSHLGMIRQSQFIGVTMREGTIRVCIFHIRPGEPRSYELNFLTEIYCMFTDLLAGRLHICILTPIVSISFYTFTPISM